MKKVLVLLLTLCMLLSMAACGGDSISNTVKDNNGDPGSSKDEAPYVEEVPASNALDTASPIPADTGTLELSPVSFEAANLTLNLPEGVTAVEEEGTDNNASIRVSSDDGTWVMWFEPFIRGEYSLSWAESNLYYGDDSIKQDWSQDIPTTLAGFPARVWANNILPGWLHPENRVDTPAVDIHIEYGETLVGPWYGMHVRLETQNPTVDTNIYEILYLRHVRAVLNNFEVIATPDGVVKTGGGITATFPARWEVLESGTGLVTAFRGTELSGGINFISSTPADPAEALSYREGEQFTTTVGGRDFYCTVEEKGDDESVYYTMQMYSDFSDSRCLSLFLNLRGFYPEDYVAFIEDDLFGSIISSMEIDPNGYQAPGTGSVDGFTSYVGFVNEYTGSDSEIEIPASIGGYDTVGIEMNAFKDNTTITSVVIPEGVTTIGTCAFEGCTNLETVVFPSTLMEIGISAFRDCPNLKDVVLPDSLAFVGGSAFQGSGTGSFTGSGAEYSYNCFKESTFDTISFAVGADISGDYIFNGCTATEINLPEDLEALGQGAFSYCQNLKNLELPSTVRYIAPYCFTNMGYLNITMGEGIEVIPEGCFSSTTLDVLVIPESVTSIESYAIYDAAYVVIQNPAVELGENAIDCDYLLINDADKFVFPDYTAFWVQDLYLDNVYDTADIQGSLDAQGVTYQAYLPVDATVDEAAGLDSYLASIGMDEIAWIGSGQSFLPSETANFIVEGDIITGVENAPTALSLPNFVMIYDDPFWYSVQPFGIADGAFAGSDVAVIYFPGNYWTGTGSKILEDCESLTDIWFNTLISEDIGYGYYSADTFAGIPDGVTVHIPACLTDDQRAATEQSLRDCGLPETAVFEYYSLR